MTNKEELKNRVHTLTNHLQAILGYLELEEYDKAMGQVKIAIKELVLLKKVVEIHCSGEHKKS